MEEINIKDFLEYLKKYILVIILVIVVFLAITVFYDKKIKTQNKDLILENNNEKKEIGI